MPNAKEPSVSPTAPLATGAGVTAVDDACSGKNPGALATLKALGIGCNGEKLTPDPNAKFANQAAEEFYVLGVDLGMHHMSFCQA